MQVISVYPNFTNKGGAQNVTVQLAKALNEHETPIILIKKCTKVVSEYEQKVKFMELTWRNVRKLAKENVIFLSHHRKCTTLLMLYKIVLGKKLHVVHVAHSTFENLKYLSLFPQKIIAISNGVKENLEQYFGISPQRIHVIYNGVKDQYDVNKVVDNTSGKIRILLPGRICALKQQVKIVEYCKGKLSPHIQIDFAGDGDERERLKQAIKDSSQFHYLGFVSMKDCLPRYDYVLLFSEKEGLGLSLIEGCMFGKPLITNDVPAVLDVNEDKKTGFVYPTFEKLVEGLNQLPLPGSEEYKWLSANARKKYEHRFTEERMIAAYKDVLSSVD